MGISISILVILLAVLAPLLRKWIVGTDRYIDETDGRRVDFWVRIILVIIFLVLLFFVVDTSDETIVKLFFIIALTITTAFQSIIEWKYLKNSKEFVVTLILWVIGLIYFFLFIL
jgi:MFS-type transporter involved in bile tolerance (Atg22 family)